ncbi:hypothetical protein BJV82DRAFT_667054 [Fennellomyces sp. T-0311]|nr:hypothetical protein BJV82DRAFT_667054 [Fennellomyces sp. T-0311]
MSEHVYIIGELFANHPKLRVVQGDWGNLKPFEESIVGHTHLLLVVHDFQNVVKIETAIARKAYATGIQQIRNQRNQSRPFPNRGAYVTLRSGRFMANNDTFEIKSIEFLNVILDTVDPDTVETWISTNDACLTTANILQDPIDKHGDALTVSERATLLSKAARLLHKFVYDFLQP